MRGSSQLTFCMLGKNFSRRHSEIVFLFFPKKLAFFLFHANLETICVTYQTNFPWGRGGGGGWWGEKRSLSSAEFAQGVMAKSMFTDRKICLMIRKRSENI